MADDGNATTTGVTSGTGGSRRFGRKSKLKGSEKKQAAPMSTMEQARKQTKRNGSGFPTHALEFFNRGVYIFIGVCFLLAALISLLYGITRFAVSVYSLAQMGLNAVQSSGGTNASNGAPDVIISFVSDLLLTLIIMEVLGTVINYLSKKRANTLRPFLFIGIISATRGILAVGARLSVSSLEQLKPGEFQNSMIELGVNAAVIIALGVTLKLIGNFLDDEVDDDDDNEHIAKSADANTIASVTTTTDGQVPAATAGGSAQMLRPQ